MSKFIYFCLTSAQLLFVISVLISINGSGIFNTNAYGNENSLKSFTSLLFSLQKSLYTWSRTGVSNSVPGGFSFNPAQTM